MHGTSTASSSAFEGLTDEGRDMRLRSADASAPERVRPVQELMYDARATVGLEARSGVITVRPSG